MPTPRDLPLFDVATQKSWNDRIAPTEYAVHYSAFQSTANTTPFCTIFPTLPEAEAYAHRHVADHPTIRCHIYDHHGLLTPLRDIRGTHYKDASDISPRFRRWVGSILFFGGILLTAIDWRTGFSLSWPAMLGTRMVIPGLILLLTEAMLLLNARRARRHLNP